MALKQPERLKNISAANPHVAANEAFINGVYLAVYGRKASPKEIDMFTGAQAMDVANRVMGGESPFKGVSGGGSFTPDPNNPGGFIYKAPAPAPAPSSVPAPAEEAKVETPTSIPEPTKPYGDVEAWVEDWDRWRQMGKDFVAKQYDEMLQDLLEEKQLKEKTTRDSLDELKIRELETRTIFRSRTVEDFNRNMTETKGDFEKSLQRMEEDRTLWASQEARDYKDAVRVRKEEFSRRGLVYSGFHEEAAAKQELERTEKIGAYETAYGRQSGDITQLYQRTTGEFERGNVRALSDYETAYTKQLNDWERQYGLQKQGETAYTYGYKKGEDIKYGVDYLGTESAGLESQGYKFFGVTPYETKQAYEKATTQTERDRIAAQEAYATQKRAEDKEAYDERRRKYYESKGYAPTY